jgi:hypothetical protein
MVTVALDRSSGALARILALGRFGVNTAPSAPTPDTLRDHAVPSPSTSPPALARKDEHAGTDRANHRPSAAAAGALAEIDADRRVPDEVIDALTRAELMRLSIPKRHGGLGTDMRTVVGGAGRGR